MGNREQLMRATGLVWYPAETDVSIRPGWFYHPEENQKVKSGQELMNIYFTSVGMNSVLLLNIPPNKEGLLSNEDVNSLKEFATLRNSIFSNRFPTNGMVVSCDNGVNTKFLTDHQYDTYFTTKKGDTTTIITFSFKAPQSVNVLMIQENIGMGQRIEAFELEYSDPQKGWIKIAEGTTVGYKRLLQFPEVNSSDFRIKIIGSRLEPTISEVGFYHW